MTILEWWILLAASWWIVRALIAWRVERAFARGNPRNHDGYIRGAEPRTLQGTRPGAVLLLHGYNDSPQTMYSVASALHRRGWTVRVPALPGHARTLPEFAASGAAQWIGAARAELAALRDSHSVVAVGGLSMGGAISMILAAEDPAVRAVIGFAPYLHSSVPLRVMHAMSWIATLGARYVNGGGGRSVHDPVADKQVIAYRCGTPRLLVQLQHVVEAARAALPRVHQPVLVIQSREDNRIPEASATEAFARIGSADKTLHWTTGGGHVVTVDYGHDAIEQVAADWLESRLP